MRTKGPGRNFIMSLYFESHITIEPVFDERLEDFKKHCAVYKYKVADLLMKKKADGPEEKSTNDSFCTARDKDFDQMKSRMLSLLALLKQEGYRILRFKIEDVVLDSRKDDSLFNLG